MQKVSPTSPPDTDAPTAPSTCIDCFALPGTKDLKAVLLVDFNDPQKGRNRVQGPHGKRLRVGVLRSYVDIENLFHSRRPFLSIIWGVCQ